MKEKKKSNYSAGDATPYWYEWYVGLNYVIELISPDTDIKSVIFQSKEAQKLDDVIINYKNGSKECIQVKNTRENNKIGFQTFVNDDDYLKAYANEWKSLRLKHGENVKVQLFSNKEASGQYNGTKKTGIYKRPPLDEFWKYIREQSNGEDVNSFSDISVKDKENWDTAWEKCKAAISILYDTQNDMRLEFIRSFDIRLGEKDLFPLEEEMINSIMNKYNIDHEKSKRVFEDLVVELRKWTTKDGKNKYSEEITHEVVIKALFGRANQFVSDHHLPVTSNFFESRKKFVAEFIDIIEKTDKKVVFLSGKPNVGKTTIISYLYNGIENIIDFRFYSFKPIHVDSKFVGADKGNSSHRGLWGDLFIQVFEFIRHDFDDYSRFKIIPYIEWMDDVKLQTEVLRLLGELATERKRKVTVAIDGIDHAARSGDKDNYLEKFCSPNSIPNNVCFIIAGQCIEGYVDAYPAWLNDSQEVKHCKVPNLIEEDIIQLYDFHQLEESRFPKISTVDFISNISNGNTLSALFAFAEAEQCNNIGNLVNKIYERKLSDGIDQYYEEIWKYCISNFSVPVRESVEIKFACILSYSRSMITGNLLSNIFKDINLSKEDWTFLLRKMMPLVSEFSNGFLLDINDVRVFFKKKINSMYNRESINDAKLALAKYYFTNPSCIQERHNEGYDLLIDSCNDTFFAENCNSSYVIEALTIKQPITEIRRQIKSAVSAMIKKRNWEISSGILCALRTLSQHDKTLQWEGNSYIETRTTDFLFKSEFSIRNKIDYDYKILSEIIKDATELFAFGKNERAKEILKGHFGNKDLTEITTIFKGDVQEFAMNDSRKDLVKKYGEITRFCELNLVIGKRNKGITKDEQVFLENYFEGWFRASTDFQKIDMNKTLVKDMIIPNGEILNNYFLALYKGRHYTHLFEVISQVNILDLNKTILLQIMAWFIQYDKSSSDSVKAIKQIKIKGDEFLKDQNWVPDYPTIHKFLAYCNMSFILGNLQNGGTNLSKVANEIYSHFDESDKNGVQYFLNINYQLGSFFAKYVNEKNIDDKVNVILSDIVKIKRRYISYFSLNEVIADVIQKIILLGNNFEDSNIQVMVFERFKGILERLDDEKEWDSVLSPIIINFLFDRGEVRKLTSYVIKACGPKSNLWKMSINDRSYIMKDINQCVKLLKMEQSFLDYLIDWNQWFCIGYSGHKEDILFDLLEIMTVFLKLKPEKWKEYYKIVMGISEIVRDFGDNQIKLGLDYMFARAATQVSLNDLYSYFLIADLNKKEECFVLSDLLKELLKNNQISYNDTVVILSYIEEQLSSGDYYDKDELYKLSIEIASCIDNCMLLDDDFQKLLDNPLIHRTYEHVTKQKNTLNDIISLEELETNSNSNNMNWEYCTNYLINLKNKRPQNTNDEVKRIIKWLKRRQATYEWRGDGVFEVYKSLISLIDDETTWLLMEHNIARLDCEPDVLRWAYLVSDVVLNLFLFNAEYMIADKIEYAVNDIIDMHIRFISGSYRFNYIDNGGIIVKDVVDEWEELIKKL